MASLLPSKLISASSIILACLLFLLQAPLTVSDPLYQSCGNTGNYTDKGIYASNLQKLLSSLSSNGSANGSYNDTRGQVPDQVFGFILCRGDTTQATCRTCLGTATQDVQQLCPNSRSAAIWYDDCLLRYSNLQIFSSVDNSPEFYMWNTQNITDPNGFNVPRPANRTDPDRFKSVNQLIRKKRNVTGVVLAIVIPLLTALALFLFLAICFLRRRPAKTILHEIIPEDIANVEFLSIDLSTIRVATANFSDVNKLGEGGFAAVYKGLLRDGRAIAVKRLSTSSGQGVKQLKNELLLAAELQHRNLVRLLGVCLEEREKLLVYEYVPNRSLDTILFDPIKRNQLNWQSRYKIIGGVARGLLYLHEDCQLKVIHRDLKASNVLLDADLNPKISDFGLARLSGGDQTQGTTSQIVGTFGYMAPEYAIRGKFSTKSDAFSFGVLVLEIVTGKKNSDFFGSECAEDLLRHTWERWINGGISEIVDPSLGDHYPRSEVLRCIQIGLLCVQEDPSDRPNMSTVVYMLSSNSMSVQAPSKPAFCAGRSGKYTGMLSKEFDLSRGMQGQSSSKSVPISPNEMSMSEMEPR